MAEGEVRIEVTADTSSALESLASVEEAMKGLCSADVLSDSTLDEQFSSLFSSLLTSAEAAAGELYSLLSSAAAEIPSAFASVNYYSIGSDIMGGIASGIRAAGDDIVAAIKEVSEEAKAAAEEFYDISSPSRVMRDEVGVMISRGIAEGILDGGSYIKSAMLSVLPSSDYAQKNSDTDSGRTSYVQNVYITSAAQTPYETARAIRRESEAMLRL